MTTTTRARERQRDLGNVPDDERARLRAVFGAVLRGERGHRTTDDVATAAGMNPNTVRRLEVGIRRPTTSSVWRLAKALRHRGTLRDVVALDERLRQAAGASLVVANTRPHRRRERVRAELRAEAGDGAVLGDHGEALGAIVAAELGRRWADVDSDPRSASG